MHQKMIKIQGKNLEKICYKIDKSQRDEKKNNSNK